MNTTDDIQQQVVGYRPLSEKDIATVNEIKCMAVQVGCLVDQLQSDGKFDARWIAIAKTNLQVGFMELTRSVTQPTTF